MKIILVFFSTIIFLCVAISSFAQKDVSRNYSSYFEKGNKTAGISAAIAGDYNTVLQLDITKKSKNYGLLLLPTYGWFVEKNWEIGVQAILGFSKNKYQYASSDTNQYSSNSTYTDFGIAPVTRYFIPLGSRNVVSVFGEASMPVIYSSSKRESKQTAGTNPYSFSDTYNELRLSGSIGLGISINGHFGSLQLSANTYGLYIGFHKYMRKK
jgi:hypothetical protein